MSKYRFVADVVIEASSQEDALSLIASRLGAVSRHLGNGHTLRATKPFFSLQDVAEKTKAVDITADSIAEATRAAEA